MKKYGGKEKKRKEKCFTCFTRDVNGCNERCRVILRSGARETRRSFLLGCFERETFREREREKAHKKCLNVWALMESCLFTQTSCSVLRLCKVCNMFSGTTGRHCQRVGSVFNTANISLFLSLSLTFFPFFTLSISTLTGQKSIAVRGNGEGRRKKVFGLMRMRMVRMLMSKLPTGANSEQ